MTRPEIDLHISLGQIVTALVGVLMSLVSSLLLWALNRVKKRLDSFLDQWDYVVVTSGAAYKVVSLKFPLEAGQAVTHMMRKRGSAAQASVNGV